MRYLITTFWDLSKPNGFTNNVFMDINNILMHDNNAEIIVGCKSKGREYDRVRYITSSHDLLLFLKCLLIIQEVDILWINSNRIHYNALLALFAYKIVYRAQDPVAYMHKVMKRSLFTCFVAYIAERVVINRARYIIIINHEMENILRITKKKVFIIYNLAGINKLSHYRYEDDRGVLKMGYLGLIQRYVRGLEFQLSLFSYIKDSMHIMRFNLLANGSDDDLSYIDGVIYTLNISQYVDMIDAPVSDERFLEILHDTDIVIMEPTPIHLPSKFFEYVYTGKLLIVNEDASAMRKMLDNYGYHYIPIRFEVNEALARLSGLDRDSILDMINDNIMIGKRMIDDLTSHNRCEYMMLISDLYATN